MPKQLWLPGGKNGGGHYETFYTADDIRKAQAQAVGKERERAPKLSDLYPPTVLPPMDDQKDSAFWQTAFAFALFVVIIGAILISGVLR